MPGIQFSRFAPDPSVTEGSILLSSGSLTATISSRATGKHLTVRVRCARRDEFGPRRWPTAPFAKASRIFIDSFDGEDVAVLDIVTGLVRFAPGATHAAQWTVAALLSFLSGASDQLTRQAELAVVAHCQRCGREITDPESLERGMGPECWGERTGSKSERAVA